MAFSLSSALWFLTKWSFASFPSVLMALLAFWLINSSTQDFMAPVLDVCLSTTKTDNSVVAFFKLFSCVNQAFLGEMLQSEEGLVIWGNFCAAGVAVCSFMAIEASRVGAKSPVTWVIPVTLIFVTVGVSIGYPLLFIPAYFLVGLTGKDPASAKKCYISRGRVKAIAFLNTLVFVLNASVILPWSKPTIDSLIVAIVWVPLLVPLGWLPCPAKTSASQDQGHSAVILYHTFNAGLSFTVHVISVLYFFTHPDVFFRYFGAIFFHEGARSVMFALVVDYCILYLSLLYQIWMEDGWLASIAAAILTPFLGSVTPFNIYFMYRERRIAAMAQSGAGKKT